jgi:hypothetical protein
MISAAVIIGALDADDADVTAAEVLVGVVVAKSSCRGGVIILLYSQLQEWYARRLTSWIPIYFAAVVGIPMKWMDN